MKKLFLLFLSLVSVLTISFAFKKANAEEETQEPEKDVVGDLYEIVNFYYNNGVYTKHTKINVDTEKIKNDLKFYFHASVSELERTTYYSGDALWMSRGVEGEGVTYSYYGTHYTDGVADGVTNAKVTTPLVHPENPKVVLKGAGKNSMEEYYVTLLDILPTQADGWTYENGVYSVVKNENIIDKFRNFTAPLWLNTEIGANYLSLERTTIEEVNGSLILKLWALGDAGKLVDGVETDGKYVLFSVATITTDKVYRKITSNGNTSGNYTIDKMIDGNLDTWAWFSQRPTNITIELAKEEVITDLYVYQTNGLAPEFEGSDDKMAADIEVSVNGVDFYKVEFLPYNEKEMHFRFATPQAAKYIRFNYIDSGTWIAVRDVMIDTLDNGGKSVTYENLELEPLVATSAYNMFDGDLNTYTWFCNNETENASFTVNYDKPILASHIGLYMSRTESPDDFFHEYEVFYSVDGKNYVSLGKYDTPDFDYYFDEKVYIKSITAVSTTTSINGVIVREFAADNKVKSIISTNCTIYSDHALEKACDGNRNTMAWIYPQVGDNLQKDAWVQLEFSEATHINNIYVVFSSEAGEADYLHGYKLQYSLDGNVWHDLVETEYVDNAYNADLRDFAYNANVEAKYIRLSGTSTASNWIKLFEFYTD